jgi:hypothetical protein
VPMATTEGALIASTNRGCAAIRRAGGATTVVVGDGMTRAPLVRVTSLREAADLRKWLEVPENFATVAAAFNSTTRFGRLQSITTMNAGRNVYLRFRAKTGDAMGMNMITKGVNEGLKAIRCVGGRGRTGAATRGSEGQRREGRGEGGEGGARPQRHLTGCVPLLGCPAQPRPKPHPHPPACSAQFPSMRVLSLSGN